MKKKLYALYQKKEIIYGNCYTSHIEVELYGVYRSRKKAIVPLDGCWWDAGGFINEISGRNYYAMVDFWREAVVRGESIELKKKRTIRFNSYLVMLVFITLWRIGKTNSASIKYFDMKTNKPIPEEEEENE